MRKCELCNGIQAVQVKRAKSSFERAPEERTKKKERSSKASERTKMKAKGKRMREPEPLVRKALPSSGAHARCEAARGNNHSPVYPS